MYVMKHWINGPTSIVIFSRLQIFSHGLFNFKSGNNGNGGLRPGLENGFEKNLGF